MREKLANLNLELADGTLKTMRDMRDESRWRMEGKERERMEREQGGGRREMEGGMWRKEREERSKVEVEETRRQSRGKEEV